MGSNVGQYKYELLSFYPHLSRKETEIWNRFIQKYPEKFDSVDYDVVCGTGHEVDEDLEEPWASNSRYLGKYKIDVVAYSGEKHYVVEIRPSAGPSAIGSSLSYAVLYEAKWDYKIEAEPVLVTDVERPDMKRLCEEHDIEYIIV